MYKQFAEPQLLGGDPRGDETDPPIIALMVGLISIEQLVTSHGGSKGLCVHYVLIGSSKHQ